MNFKPLENEKQYKATKNIVKDFKKEIDEFLKIYKDSKSFWFFTKHFIYTINIMEAEIQDYEHRKNGDY